MDLISGQPYWPCKNGRLTAYPSLEEDLVTDTAIIGGGITGALVAYYLTAAGIPCVLLDKREIGRGSTAASTALLLYESDVDLHELIPLVGEENAVRSYHLSRQAISKIGALVNELGDDCGYEQRDSLYLAVEEDDAALLRTEAATRNRHGLPCEYWPREKVAAHFSFDRPAAIFTREGAQVDPFRLAHRLLQRGVEGGLRVFERTTVKKYEACPEGVELVTEDGRRVQAKRAVFAAGYETQEYLTQKVTQLKSTYVMMTTPLESFDGWPGRCLMWDTARPYLYLRTTVDNRAIIGGLDEDFRDPDARDALLDSKTRELAQKFGALFPALRFSVALSWCGTFGETEDGLAYIGATPEFPNALFALGYGGNGITYSVTAAGIIRDACLGRENADARIFRFDR